MQLFTALLSVLTFVSLTTASPIADAAVVERSVATVQFTVQITDPVFGDFWEIGFENPVKWDKTTIPTQAENDTVNLLLGYYDNNNVEHVNSSKLHFSPSIALHFIFLMNTVVPCSNLTYADTPLASGFQLGSGNQVVTTPNVTNLATYFIVRK
jgi:hypothetical protein